MIKLLKKHSIFILCLGFLLITLFFLKDNENNLKFIIYYMFIFGIAVSFPSKNRHVLIILQIICLPGHLLILLGPFIKSFIMVFITFFTVFCLSFFTFSYQHLITNYTPPQSIIMYLTLIFSSIILVEFYDEILKLFVKFFHKDSDSDKEGFIRDLSQSILNKNKIRFLIYLIYFIFLIPFSFLRLNNVSSTDNDLALYALFYSFSTFLAYEKVRQNLDLMTINVKKTFVDLLRNSPFYTKEPKN